MSRTVAITQSADPRCIPTDISPNALQKIKSSSLHITPPNCHLKTLNKRGFGHSEGSHGWEAHVRGPRQEVEVGVLRANRGGKVVAGNRGGGGGGDDGGVGGDRLHARLAQNPDFMVVDSRCNNFSRVLKLTELSNKGAMLIWKGLDIAHMSAKSEVETPGERWSLEDKNGMVNSREAKGNGEKSVQHCPSECACKLEIHI
ncbi:hypothetical protein E2542_SST01931 [Spatholobus suberectus]|nr:hypothetical protein E2542_SST01931 [Spatholobus suberectus]